MQTLSSSKEVYEGLNGEISYATIKRRLVNLLDKQYIIREHLSVSRIENIHSLLIKELGVDRNIRTRRVGITGTNYRPIESEFQIREALEQTCSLVNSRTNIFEKALLVLVLLSYIQAFNDGNKRVARITSNAILIANKYCPVSFRTVDSVDYRKRCFYFMSKTIFRPLSRFLSISLNLL